MINVVIDTNVLVSALMKENSKPAKIWNSFCSDFIQAYYSDMIMKEYLDVLYRPHLKISAYKADKLIDNMKEAGIRITPPVSAIPLPDETDRVFYDTAVAAGAYLVTGNMKHYPAEPFILTPAAFSDLLTNEQ